MEQITVDLTGARARLGELVNTVHHGNTTVVITRQGKPHAVLVDHDDYQAMHAAAEDRRVH